MRLHVLHHAAREPVHGTWLIAELQKHGHDVSPGTLYPILHSMEGNGLITSEHNVIDGKRLRRYVITDQGRAALELCVRCNEVRKCRGRTRPCVAGRGGRRSRWRRQSRRVGPR